MNELVILSALLRAPAYGYALKKTAGLTYGRTLHPNVVYPVLKKFVQNGWVEQSSKPGERGQTRKQYRITAAGRKYLLEHLASFTEAEASDGGAFLFRVTFFDLLPVAKRQEILASRKRFLDARAVGLAKLPGEIEIESFGEMALDRVRAVIQDELRWIRQLEVEVESVRRNAKRSEPTRTRS